MSLSREYSILISLLFMDDAAWNVFVARLLQLTWNDNVMLVKPMVDDGPLVIRPKPFNSTQRSSVLKHSSASALYVTEPVCVHRDDVVESIGSDHMVVCCAND